MKKLIKLMLIAFPTFLTLGSCGGKNMDETPDYSNTGPRYLNEGENWNQKRGVSCDTTPSLRVHE